MSKDEYMSNGYTKWDGFFTKDEIKKMNDIIDKLEEELKPCDTVFDESNTGKIKQIQYLQNRDDYFKKILYKIDKIAEDLLDKSFLSFNVLNMQLFEKHPGISKPTRSHQDNAYFKLTPTTPLTFWIALDDIDEENGCLYYAPKTHLTPTRKHQRYHKDTTFRVRSGVPGLSLCLHEHPEEKDIPMICKSGDLFVHNCNLVHRAGKNNSVSRRRRAIGIVYVPNDCREDELLVKYHNERLKEDIELQRIKDPMLYEELKKKFEYLF